MGWYEIKTLCTAKETIKIMKIEPMEWEKIFACLTEHYNPECINDSKNLIPKNK